MAYLTGDWLKGNPDRLRGHDPWAVTLSTSLPGHPWDKEHGVQTVLPPQGRTTIITSFC
jgi:hypothetical protein